MVELAMVPFGEDEFAVEADRNSGAVPLAALSVSTALTGCACGTYPTGADI
jgi:hypothetical protein